MLQIIRQKTKGWFTGVLLALITAAFIFYGIELGSRGNKLVMQVGSFKLTEAAFEKIFERRKSDFIAENKEIEWTREFEKDFRSKLLKELTVTAKFNQSRQKLRLIVNEDDLQRAVQSLPEFQEEGKFVPQKLTDFLAIRNWSPKFFITVLMQQLLEEQERIGVVESEFLLPFELSNLGESFYQEREVAIINLSDMVTKDVPSEIEEKAYYQEHLDEFKKTAQVRFEYLILDAEALEENKISEAEAYSFYKTHLDYYTLPRRWQLLFAQLNYSNQKNSKEAVSQELLKIKQKLQQGEDLVPQANLRVEKDWFLEGSFRGKLSAYLDKALPGEVFTLLENEQGFVLTKILAVEPKVVKTFDQVREQVFVAAKKYYLGEKFTHLYNDLTELTFNNPENLEIAAEQLNLPLKRSDWLTKGEVVQKFNYLVGEQVFDREFFKRRTNSSLLELASGKIIVIRVTDYRTNEPFSFEEVKSIIKQKLYEQSLTRAKQDVLNNLHKAIAQGENLQRFMRLNHFPFKEERFVGGETNKFEEFRESVFQLPNKIGAYFLSDSWLIVQLNVRKGKVPNDFPYLVNSLGTEALNHLHTYLQQSLKVREALVN